MKGQKTVSARPLSASEIARNVKHFDAWSTFQGCEEVAFSDIPPELKADVLSVFDVKGRLPARWVDKSSKCYSRLRKLSPDLHEFVKRAYKESPFLFSEEVSMESCGSLISALSCLLLAWNQLQWMRRTREKWSEADFAANVYNVIRTPAFRESAYRTQCSISLPNHPTHIFPSLPSSRVLSARNVIPDSTIFLPSLVLRPLSSTKSSAYKTLAAHPSTKASCSRTAETAFKYQATPCALPTEHPCFEFASCAMEDKKNGIDLEHAYRQNRMGTAALVRHLRSLHIHSPIFGLVWADGRVRAHVDWWCKDVEQMSVQSAPYPPTSEDTESSSNSDSNDEHGHTSSPMFHEWDLEKPSDIIALYLLIRNIDTWTSGRFKHRVHEGVESLVHAVVHNGESYHPWKRVDPLPRPEKKAPIRKVTNTVENTPPPPPNNTGFPTPPPGPKRRFGTKSAQGQVGRSASTRR